MHAHLIDDNQPEATGLRRIRIATPTPAPTAPGQYVKVALAPDEKPSYFAIASTPGEPLTLLIKGEGPVGVRLAELHAGATLWISEPLGGGFALDRTRDRSTIIFCNGSGLSAIRPVILHQIACGAAPRTHLYYGVMSPQHVAFADDLAAWRRAGVHVTVAADPGCTEPGALPSGYIQDFAERDGHIRNDVAVVLVGVPAMIADVKDRYRAAGLPETLLLTNF